MKRESKTSVSLLEHWAKYLSAVMGGEKMSEHQTELSADIRRLEVELENIPNRHLRKKTVLQNEYRHWLYLMEIVGESVEEDDSPF